MMMEMVIMTEIMMGVMVALIVEVGVGIVPVQEVETVMDQVVVMEAIIIPVCSLIQLLVQHITILMAVVMAMAQEVVMVPEAVQMAVVMAMAPEAVMVPEAVQTVTPEVGVMMAIVLFVMEVLPSR
jgi:hypothetical protein